MEKFSAKQNCATVTSKLFLRFLLLKYIFLSLGIYKLFLLLILDRQCLEMSFNLFLNEFSPAQL